MASSWEHPGLSARQRTRLEQLHPAAHRVADHSSPFGITVLEFVHAGRRLLLKASDNPHHLEREYRALAAGSTRWVPTCRNWSDTTPRPGCS